MADIFLAYASEDKVRAEMLAAALELRGGRSVWWDRHIRLGEDFYEVIGKELATAGCIVVLWSEAALKSKDVRTEAQAGLPRRLVPVLLEAVEPPHPFHSL